MSASGEFVDSNILVYAHDPTTPAKHLRARELMERLWVEKTGRLSIQVLQEFFWTITRKIPQPLRGEEARVLLKDLSHWPVFSPEAPDVIAATHLAEEAKISFWDAMIVTAARQVKAICVWSEDLSDGQVIEGVEIRNPFREP